MKKCYFKWIAMWLAIFGMLFFSCKQNHNSPNNQNPTPTPKEDDPSFPTPKDMKVHGTPVYLKTWSVKVGNEKTSVAKGDVEVVFDIGGGGGINL